jgi:hypothetical protein
MYYDFLALIIWCTGFSINFLVQAVQNLNRPEGGVHLSRNLKTFGLSYRLGELISLSYTMLAF